MRNLYLNSTEVWGSNDGNDWNLPSSVTMTDTEASTFSATYADIETYLTETVLKWITGQETLTENAFEEFKDNLETMNIDTCIGIKQDAYDRYAERGV